ncbi:MAG: AAA family ATPase [Clostridia bacterium]|nr:AAA family ATPase [Clostridia bacterium]
MAGTIIILNGPSSSGKSTLSRNLQKIWPTPLYYTSYDLVEEQMAPYIYSRHAYEGFPSPVKDFLDVMYITAAAMANTGRDVVIDNCLFDTEDIIDLCRDRLAGIPQVWVRVKLDQEELDRREKARGNRAIGKARWQAEHITPKEDAAYDVIVDTANPSEECARSILRAVQNLEK